MRALAAWLIAAGLLLLMIWLFRRRSSRGLTHDRLFAEDASQARARVSDRVDQQGFLRRWLFLAGFRHPAAPLLFVLATLCSVSLGVLAALGFRFSAVHRSILTTVEAIPGGTGDVFLPLVLAAPWLMLLMIGALPWLIVRAVRQQRVEQVTQDLPLMLELFATLSEAGLGFDAALARILNTRLAGRPLAAEFRTFQVDLLSGRTRQDGLRRLARRLNVMAVSIFVSAVVQADQLGMGLASVLRTQADDMRSRRRERAMTFSNSLPVKRLFPLVICFLPGLFIWTLGPLFLQLFQLADTFVRVRNF